MEAPLFQTWLWIIDGMTDIGAALADADLMIVDDGAGGTNRKATMSRLKTYMQNNLTFTTNTDVNVSKANPHNCSRLIHW